MITLARHVGRLLNLHQAVAVDHASSTADSSQHAIIDRSEALAHGIDAWQESAVALRQHEAYRPLLDDMRSGRPRRDL